MPIEIAVSLLAACCAGGAYWLGFGAGRHAMRRDLKAKWVAQQQGLRTIPPQVLDDRQELCSEAALFHDKLVRNGMYRTGHAMHNVVREIGYELAEQLTKELGQQEG